VESLWADPLPDTGTAEKRPTRRRTQGATLQELTDSYDRSISTMRRATRCLRYATAADGVSS
jgi:hypothetical protein